VTASGSNYNVRGTVRFDNVTISGDPLLIQPASLTATLTNAMLQIAVTGTPGQKYAIEYSDVIGSWTPVVTNSAPFDFSSYVAQPSSFYRAVLSP